MKEFDPKKRAKKALENMANNGPSGYWISDKVMRIIDVTGDHSAQFESQEARRREEERESGLRKCKAYDASWGSW